MENNPAEIKTLPFTVLLEQKWFYVNKFNFMLKVGVNVWVGYIKSMQSNKNKIKIIKSKKKRTLEENNATLST